MCNALILLKSAVDTVVAMDPASFGKCGLNGITGDLVKHINYAQGKEGLERCWNVDVFLDFGNKGGVDNVLHSTLNTHFELA